MNRILSQLAVRNGNKAEASAESIMALGEVVSSLRTAVSKLQNLKDSETNHYFRNFETNFPKEGIDFYKATRLYEINLVKQALRVTRGHQANAAKLLKMRTSTLNSFIKRHNISY
ncbi:MAG TPA: helix-turn-helix domain-containing protein [Aridibacter sp.]|nr:helix-turn-helix domain-containing protein [Aridibacter sp.]